MKWKNLWCVPVIGIGLLLTSCDQKRERERAEKAEQEVLLMKAKLKEAEAKGLAKDGSTPKIGERHLCDR